MHLVSRPSGCGVSYAHARLECFFASRRKVVGTCRRRCHPNLPPPSKLLWSLFPLAVGEKQSFRMACLQGNCLRHIELSNYGSSCFPYYEKSLQTNHHDAPGVFFRNDLLHGPSNSAFGGNAWRPFGSINSLGAHGEQDLSRKKEYNHPTNPSFSPMAMD